MAQLVDTFWTPDRVLLVIVFLAGLLIGVVLTNRYIDPFLGKGVAKDQNALLAENARLDARADELYKCLVENDVPPGICGIETPSEAGWDANTRA